MPEPWTEETPESFERTFRSACAAGAKAAAAARPPLMIVVDPVGIHAPASGERVPGLWFEQDGPVGMAAILIQPSTCRFVRWLLLSGYARKSHDRPGAYVSPTISSQSIHKAAAYALAFALVIERSGFGVRTEIVLHYD